MKKYLYTISFLTFIFPFSPAHAQVEHNFEMGPENTNCDKLPHSFKSAAAALVRIDSSTFRFRESIDLSRFRTPRSATYYSCDGKTGFLVVQETTDSRVIYSDIPKTVWENFINSDDPFDFYAHHVKAIYSTIE